MRGILFFLFCFSVLSSSAQDLSGIWRGHFVSGNGSRLYDSTDDRYKFEVQLQQNDKFFKGVTYSYRTTVFYGKASCYGAINKQNKKVFLEEIKILEVKSYGGGACIMTCFLQYSKVGGEEVLEGNYTSMSTADSTQCGRGTVFLRKVDNSDFYKEPFLAEKPKQKPKKVPDPAPEKIVPPVVKSTPKQQPPLVIKKPLSPVKKKPDTTPKDSSVAALKRNTLKNIPADSLKDIIGKDKTSAVPVPRVLSSRTNELVRTITTSANNITIKIYDNGTIDNDTVSVYVDKKLVISRERLTDKAIMVNLTLDDRIQQHELVMVAENLGEIPPNTSLMVVNAGDQQYEVRITSTEQKNAVVLFRYDKAK